MLGKGSCTLWPLRIGGYVELIVVEFGVSQENTEYLFAKFESKVLAMKKMKMERGDREA